MIRIKVGLALKLTDGYTGEAVSGKGLVFSVDGIPKAMIEKPGGFYALTGVGPGRHELCIGSVIYRPETLFFEAGMDLIPVTLKPGAKYSFGPGSHAVSVRNRGTGKITFYTGRKTQGSEIKIAQSDLAAGDRDFKLFFGSRKKLPSLPADMLIEDGPETEVLLLEDVDDDGKGIPARPLTNGHRRGCRLLPAQKYTLSGGEETRICFPGNSEEFIFVPVTRDWFSALEAEEVVLCGKEE